MVGYGLRFLIFEGKSGLVLTILIVSTETTYQGTSLCVFDTIYLKVLESHFLENIFLIY